MSESDGQDQHLTEAFRRAAAIAATVPTALQEAAFNRALDAVLNATGNQGKQQRRQLPSEDDDTSDPIATVLAISRSSAEEVDNEDGALGKALALLHVAEREADVPGLTAPQIAYVLTTKFKWKVSRQAITQALDRAGKMVDSTVGSGARIYTIMASGVEYLNQPVDERPMALAAGSGQRRRRRLPRGNSRPGSGSAVSPEGDNDSRLATPRKQSRRAGPKEAIEQLISNDFFSSPRMLAAIREELRVSRGLAYKSTDLSPVMTRLLREGRLIRSRNGESQQYEYVCG
jgi:hypothetical protein